MTVYSASQHRSTSAGMLEDTYIHSERTEERGGHLAIWHHAYVAAWDTHNSTLDWLGLSPGYAMNSRFMLVHILGVSEDGSRSSVPATYT